MPHPHSSLSAAKMRTAVGKPLQLDPGCPIITPVNTQRKTWDLRARYLNTHLFEAPIKRVDNQARVDAAEMIVVLAGRYEAKLSLIHI